MTVVCKGFLPYHILHILQLHQLIFEELLAQFQMKYGTKIPYPVLANLVVESKNKDDLNQQAEPSSRSSGFSTNVFGEVIRSWN